MSLFFAKKDRKVQNYVLKLVNTNCPGLKASEDGPRLSSRVNLVVVVTVVPVQGGKLSASEVFQTVTREFSNTGVSLVLNGPIALDEVILGFRAFGESTFIRAKAKHCNPMGGNFYQMGFKLIEMVTPADYPELPSLIHR